MHQIILLDQGALNDITACFGEDYQEFYCIREVKTATEVFQLLQERSFSIVLIENCSAYGCGAIFDSFALNDKEQLHTGENLVKIIRSELDIGYSIWIGLMTRCSPLDIDKEVSRLVKRNGIIIPKPYNPVAVEMLICKVLKISCKAPQSQLV